MITKVSIKKVASYGETPAVLETNKKINLVYGLNGAGKTIFSNYLANRDQRDFFDCIIEGLKDEKILVYNQNFIKENFYQKDTQKGIFTLSSENKEAGKKITNAKEKIDKINLQLENKETQRGHNYDLKKKKKEITQLANNSKEKTWEIKTTYSGGDRILEFCLEGKRSKQEDLFNYILGTKNPKNKPEKTIEKLKEEAEATQRKNATTYNENAIQKINFDFSEIEEENIFSEIIVGNENIAIANLIKELGNADWVKQGLDYLPNIDKENENHSDETIQEKSKCPFCQNKTITTELQQQIKDYFDETYQNKITKLNDLDSKYFKAWQDVKNKEELFLKNPFIKNKEKEFKLTYKNFTEKLSKNRSKINEKIKNPSEEIILESTILEKNELNDFLDKIIEEIKTHNSKIENKEKTKKEITHTFWQIMRWDYDQTIENYKSQKEKLKEEEKEIENQISELKNKNNKQRDIIKEAQKEIINIDEAIDNINTELKFLGAEEFKIEKEGADFYKIKRENEREAQFETLSEGEKTIISFLYFLELCKGKEKENEVLTEKIVVIDDPISSLSHIYIFNVAQLTKKTFFNNNYKQIFILTHSLYFFHELIKISNNNNLFRIYKAESGESNISKMKKNEILNDYQAYWQILKDDKSPNALLANSIRNILEYFFGFIDKEEFKNAVKNIEKESEYQFFIRYVQRESHSDFINISDMKEIDPDIFKKAFKKIFKESGYEKHYIKMMK
jgi:wobble nucleotide-excising tRNase